MDENNFEKEENKKNKQNGFLDDLYDDFFYLFTSNPEKYEKEVFNINDSKVPEIKIPETALRKEESSKEETPKEEVPEEKVQVITKEDKEAKINDIYKRIDDTHLTEESKEVLKKMIDYARQYDSGITKNYIPFNMRIYADNNDKIYL